LAPLAAATLLLERLLPAELTQAPAIQQVDDSGTAHTVARLFDEADLRVLWVCALSAVVVAPIVEEFFFRVLLQGWLEAGQRRLRPQMPTLGRLVPGALGPILLTALLFARVHFRVDTPMLPASFLTLILAADGAAKLVAMTFAVVLLRAGFGATVADLGWVRERFLADVGLGLLAFAAVAAPIYAAFLLLGNLVLPKYLAPDPFVLFPFALVLGILYHRTHRIVPAIVLHMSLNATSLAMAWLLMGK
jgi:membrane protease YdiL (CAAX protease family)